MQQYLAELGELNQLCCTRFFQNAEAAGIIPWYKSPKSKAETRAAVLFAAYDNWHTCFRILPGSHRYSLTSLRHGLITSDVANRLQRRLLDVCARLIENYDGFFSRELREGKVGKIVRQTLNKTDLSLDEAHHNLFSDELFAAIPWPCEPSHHLDIPHFSSIGIGRYEYKARRKEHLNALAAAIEHVNLAPSMNLSPKTIFAVLEWLEKGAPDSLPESVRRGDSSVKKIIVHSLASGFQGVALGIFYNLQAELEPFAKNQINQFTETIGEACARLKLQEARRAFESAKNAADLARSCINLLPPSRYVIAKRDSDWVGYRLRYEHNYFASYEPISPEHIEDQTDDPHKIVVKLNVNGAPVEIEIGTVKDCSGLDPVFTKLRIESLLVEACSLLRQKNNLVVLKKSDLEQARDDLLTCVNQTSAKILYLIESVLKKYDDGEITLNNSKSRKFLEKLLSVPIHNNYQVCGQAAKKFKADLDKFLPNQFRIEASRYNLSVRWIPNNDLRA